jgi:hypothetical protein
MSRNRSQSGHSSFVGECTRTQELDLKFSGTKVPKSSCPTADLEYAMPAILQTRVHTMLSVPILEVGTTTITRREVAPFSQAPVDLLKTFADQAVSKIPSV